jgi:hypothetical protein
MPEAVRRPNERMVGGASPLTANAQQRGWWWMASPPRFREGLLDVWCDHSTTAARRAPKAPGGSRGVPRSTPTRFVGPSRLPDCHREAKAGARCEDLEPSRRCAARRENSYRPPSSGSGARSPLNRGPRLKPGSGRSDIPSAPKKQGVDTPPRRFYSSGLDSAAMPAAHRPPAACSRKKPGRGAFLPGREARPPPRPCDRHDREVVHGCR